jgi:membrane protease YdiL (CAAX protease family)
MFPFSAVSLSTIPWDFSVILIVLGVLVPWRGAVRIKRLLAQDALTTSQRLTLYASTISFEWFLVAVIFWRAFSRHWSPNDLGLAVARVWQTMLVTLVATVPLCVNQWAGVRKIARLPPDKRGFLFSFTQKIMPQTPTEALTFVALASTAGLSEEFVYRGFVFAVFSRAFAGSGFAALFALVFSSAWFAMAHLYQGRRGVTTTFVVGLLFSAVRIWTGNIMPAIIGHISVDLVAGLYTPRVLRTTPEPGLPSGPMNEGY